MRHVASVVRERSSASGCYDALFFGGTFWVG